MTQRRPPLAVGALGLALATGITAAALADAGSDDSSGGLDHTGGC